MGREQVFVKDGLKPGDVVVCEVRIGTIYITRDKSPDADSAGSDVLLWGNGDNKKYVSSITDRGSFVDFVFALAESHNCTIRLTHRSEERMACVLVGKDD